MHSVFFFVTVHTYYKLLPILSLEKTHQRKEHWRLACDKCVALLTRGEGRLTLRWNFKQKRLDREQHVKQQDLKHWTAGPVCSDLESGSNPVYLPTGVVLFRCILKSHPYYIPHFSSTLSDHKYQATQKTPLEIGARLHTSLLLTVTIKHPLCLGD